MKGLHSQNQKLPVEKSHNILYNILESKIGRNTNTRYLKIQFFCFKSELLLSTQ